MNSLHISQILRNQAAMVGEAKRTLQQIVEIANDDGSDSSHEIKKMTADALNKMREHGQNTEDI